MADKLVLLVVIDGGITVRLVLLGPVQVIKVTEDGLFVLGEFGGVVGLIEVDRDAANLPGHHADPA